MTERLIRDVSRIDRTPDRSLNGDGLEQYIEEPLRKGVSELWNKVIRPFWSTANIRNDEAAIIIEIDCLSPANREITRAKFDYVEEHTRVWVGLPITPDTPIGVVEQYFFDIAQQFIDQSGTSWDYTYRDKSTPTT